MKLLKKYKEDFETKSPEGSPSKTPPRTRAICAVYSKSFLLPRTITSTPNIANSETEGKQNPVITQHTPEFIALSHHFSSKTKKNLKLFQSPDSKRKLYGGIYSIAVQEEIAAFEGSKEPTARKLF